MKIIGELDRSFDNFLTLRGLAKMGDLEKISFANKGYQRDLYKEQGKAMVNFLKGGEYTFYPELILSSALGDEKTDEKVQQKIRELYESIPRNNFRKTKFKDFSLKAVSQKLSDRGQDLRAPTYYCRGELTLDDPPKKILQIIDGNHRLSATKEAEKENEMVPFCIIFYQHQQQAEKFNRVLFNNINFKSLPLTSEENLRLIFEKDNNHKYIFSGEELKNPTLFGKHYIQARKLFNGMSLKNLEYIRTILKKDGKHLYTRTMLLEIIQLYKKSITLNRFQDTLCKVNNCYSEYPKTTSYQLLVVHLYYQLNDKLSIFSNWIKTNHFYKLKQVDPSGLVAIFDQVMDSKRRTIFLAMPFKDETEQNKKAIKDAIDAINKELSEDLKLRFIRIDDYKQGHSTTIVDEILKNIEEGGYLIADISLANSNVYYEIGYQMGFNKGKGNHQNNFLLVHNSGITDADFDKDKCFNINYLSIEMATDSNDLREKVKEQLIQFYGLNNG